MQLSRCRPDCPGMSSASVDPMLQDGLTSSSDELQGDTIVRFGTCTPSLHAISGYGRKHGVY